MVEAVRFSDAIFSRSNLGEGVYLCPLRVDSHVPVATSQRQIVLSKLPVASLRPSGLHETDVT